MNLSPEPTIFAKSRGGAGEQRVSAGVAGELKGIPQELIRTRPAGLPEMSELDVVRHYTRLSQTNFCVDTNFYPLGSCTMKYNPRVAEAAAVLDGFTRLSPWIPLLPAGEEKVQGALQLLYELEQMLCAVTGMAAFTLQPMAGANGELTGVLLMAAYHRHKRNRKRHIIIPDSAHGTNPASARLAGYDVVTVPSDASGVMDFDAFKRALSAETAGVMLTVPNTLGVFNPRVPEIAELVHGVDGLMYYDGANLNALLGWCKPAELGFDICHLNLHKTFGTPHGGGGPGAGPVGVRPDLVGFLPEPAIIREKPERYRLAERGAKSIGKIAPFFGNFGVLVRAYVYLRMLGPQGLRAVSGAAVLHANYVLERLRRTYRPAVEGRCMHECVLSADTLKPSGVHALDVAKALIDRGIHPPTVYFPLIVPEALMIEPTESENLATLDEFCAAMEEIARLAREAPEQLKEAPQSGKGRTRVGRLDEVAAARNLELTDTAG